ncbi:MAG: hypothetical protein M3P30_02375 [Chloroflexota bacterium]|nr:hypothetical protein [Chloroflexota bacterium]
MAWDVQINPTAEALHITPQLAQLLESHVNEFNILYGWLDPDPKVIDALREFKPSGDEEVRAVREMIELLESGRGSRSPARPLICSYSFPM